MFNMLNMWTVKANTLENQEGKLLIFTKLWKFGENHHISDPLQNLEISVKFSIFENLTKKSWIFENRDFRNMNFRQFQRRWESGEICMKTMKISPNSQRLWNCAKNGLKNDKNPVNHE